MSPKAENLFADLFRETAHHADGNDHDRYTECVGCNSNGDDKARKRFFTSAGDMFSDMPGGIQKDLFLLQLLGD